MPYSDWENNQTQGADGVYSCADLRSVNKIIGTTTEEIVFKAKEGDAAAT